MSNPNDRFQIQRTSEPIQIQQQTELLERIKNDPSLGLGPEDMNSQYVTRLVMILKAGAFADISMARFAAVVAEWSPIKRIQWSAHHAPDGVAQYSVRGDHRERH